MTKHSYGRRDVLAILGGAAGWPILAQGQQPERVRRVGVLTVLAQSDPEAMLRVVAFERELQNLGWTKDRNIRIEYRWASGDTDQIRNFATELVGMSPDVLVAHPTPSAEAVARETRTIPIVFALVSDPVRSGVAASLARPGGNATGFTSFVPSLGGKWIEILKEMSPRIGRVALLFNPETSPARGSIYLAPVEAAARTLGVQTVAAEVRSSAELGHVLPTLARDSTNALVVMPDTFTTVHRELIVSLAARHRLPAVYPFRYFATDGGLVSYGIDVASVFRRAASYVDKILRGSVPGDLPVLHPDKFELVINLKTANELGLTVPRVLLARADELIQ